MDKKWIYLIKNKPLLPDGHRIRLIVVSDPHMISIKCRKYFYDPVFELLKLETTHDIAMRAYFRLLATLKSPLVIAPIGGVKLIQLRWNARASFVAGNSLKTKLYFTPQHDQLEEENRRLARQQMSEQNYLDLVEKFERATKKHSKSGLKPRLNEIFLRIQPDKRQRDVPTKLKSITPTPIESKVDESRPQAAHATETCDSICAQ